MNSYELHQAGILSTEDAIRVAMLNDGWPPDVATAALAGHVETAVAVAVAAVESTPRHWQRWTPDELAAIDQAIRDADGKVPGGAVIRTLAERLDRKHKSVLSAIERRIARGENR